MASFSRSFFFITIVLSTLVLSTQIHARESYFFHKLQRDNAQYKNPSSVPLDTNQKTSEGVLPKKEQEQQDEDPRFVPESQNGYGLYGHETTYNNQESNKQYEENVNHEPYNTPTSLSQTEESYNYEPYNTPSLSQTEESYNYDKYSKDNENYKYDNNNNNNNNNEDKNYYNSNAYGRERSSGYNVERQGMSDTRFMENGKYYFDVNDDKNHGELYKKRYRHNPSYAASNYDRFGQNNNGGRLYDYDNNNNNYEQNSFQDPYNSKWEKNMMNEQEQEEEEFEREPQDQFVP